MTIMHICYLSSYCDISLFDSVVTIGNSLNNAIQKFNKLLITGLLHHDDISLDLFSVPDSQDKSTWNTSLMANTKSESGIKIKYAPIWNIPGMRHIGILISSFFYVLFQPAKTVVLSDVLKVSCCLGGWFAARVRGFKTIGIVTDLPMYQPIADSSIMLKINNWALKHQDGYVFLTEATNDQINLNHKPYTIIEGFADTVMKNREHQTWNEKKIVIYAGSLCVKYGIDTLVNAFNKVYKDNEELWIYGTGDYVESLQDLCASNSNIHFWGKKTNDEVVRAELQATILVNPRTAKGEYTKYSFPSKTLEYLATGTPVLMHRLPGIPSEYDSYLYYFSGEDIDDVANGLRKALDTPILELKEKGIAAKNFVLSKKNEIEQTKKLVKLIREIRGIDKIEF